MRQLYAQCRQMMKVTDEEIEAYRKAREQIEKNVSEEDEDANDIYEIIELQRSINESKAKISTKSASASASMKRN